MDELLKTWDKIKSMTRIALTGKVAPDIVGIDEEHIKKQIHQCVYAKGGEILGRSRAVELGCTFLGLSKEGRRKFLDILAHDFDADPQEIQKAIDIFQAAKKEDDRIRAQTQLALALVPPRVRLLKQFNSLPNGFKFLIDLRAELLPIRKQNPYLGKLDNDLKRLLSSWFDIELLDLKEITWQSPASLLEKLIQYERVHEIRSWSDLKNRLDSDRQCFAFFHNKIENEPLIFVSVALVKAISSSVQVLLDETADTMDPEEADTAIFYSITNAQPGLAGINLGNFLIKRVVKVLRKKFKNLEHFATLSPLPRFRQWLDPLLEKGDTSLLKPDEIPVLTAGQPDTNAARRLFTHLNSTWQKEPALAAALEPILTRLCAHYLLEVKRGEKAFDPVANFHLSNGARLERINRLGDTSEKGMKQSAGLMVNYYYDLPKIEKNHEFYITESRINASKEVRRLIS